MDLVVDQYSLYKYRQKSTGEDKCNIHKSRMDPGVP